MKRAALIAGLSIAACSTIPTDVSAWPGDAESWTPGYRPVARYSPSPQPATRPRLRKPERQERKTDNTPRIPPGPLHIIVSIDKQRATLFADGVSVASTAVSSGTRDHPTPMGVFTVIQKSRHHISNLYNAPMPYMQRITWSGSALHEGPLPGYPASHGCVRLTSGFAQLLWKATKMGARVIVTRPEVAPAAFEHARLFVPKLKMVHAPDTPLPAPKPGAAAPAAAVFALSSTRIRTADATNTIGAAIPSVVGDDAKPVVTEHAANMPAPVAEQPATPAATDSADDAPKPETAAVTAPAAESNSTGTEPTGTASAATPAAETKPAETKPAEIKPAETPVVETKSAPIIAAPAPIIVDERPKEMPAAVVREADRGPISVFVSLKESKLYVRQGWKPLFDAPVSFERPDQPIGTHVYTAMGFKVSGDGLRWTVVSIPSGYRKMAELKSPKIGRKAHHEHVKPIEAAGPPPSPAAALDRLVIAPELVERISELVTPGSSLIVSDNKLSDETGEYTDFIVLTR